MKCSHMCWTLGPQEGGAGLKGGRKIESWRSEEVSPWGHALEVVPVPACSPPLLLASHPPRAEETS